MPTQTLPSETGRRLSLSEILENPSLPSPPALVLQIVEKVSKPDCNPNEVVALLSKDSGLCGQVLKTVNSGLFGLSRPVGSLKHAVALLGLRPLRSLVLSLALPAMRTTSRDEVVERFWQESVAGAVIARQLAQLLRRPDPDDDLITGLLRDLGVLILHQAYPGEYLNLRRRRSMSWAARQCSLEEEAFGADHTEISAVLLETWQLPEEIYLPIRWHHDPSRCTSTAKPLLDRAYLLYFAGKVAMLDDASPVTELVQWAQRHFGIDRYRALSSFSVRSRRRSRNSRPS